MISKLYWIKSLPIACLVVLLGACAHHDGPGHPVTGVNPDGSPAWARKGGGGFDGPHGRAFYGVGLVQGIANPSLSRQTAGNRARGEIAKLFNTSQTIITNML